MLEPQTTTVFSEFFVAESQTLYEVIFRLPYTEPDGEKHFQWSKKRMLFVK